MGKRTNIAFARSSEAISICQAVIALGANYKTSVMRFNLFCELESMRSLGGDFIALRMGETTVGAALLSPRFCNGKEFEVVRLKRIAIHPALRGMGYARKMVDHFCNVFPKVDAASETEAGFEFLKKTMPYKKKQQAPLCAMQKNEGLQKRYAWVFSTFPIDFGNPNLDHATGTIASEAALDIAVGSWVKFEQYLSSQDICEWWGAGEQQC